MATWSATWSASGDDGATAGAESDPLLELWRCSLGGVPQPATIDAVGRGRSVHAGDPTVSDRVLCAVSPGVSARRGRRTGAAARRVRAHGEFGLAVLALVGQLRYREHRSVPEIHQELGKRGVVLAERTVTNLIERYEELVALRLTDHHRLRDRLVREGGVVLALDGMQPDVGHEVLWVIRDCLTGEPLLARSLLSGTEADLAALLREVKEALPVPILGVVSDGQQSIGKAVASALPGIPHQLCQFHYLREAARPRSLWCARGWAAPECGAHATGSARSP